MKLFKHILSIFAILACSAAFAQQDVPGGATSVGEGENLGAGVASSQTSSDMSVEAATDKDAKPIEINATDNNGIVHLAVKVNMDKASEITDDMIVQHLTTALPSEHVMTFTLPIPSNACEMSSRRTGWGTSKKT